MLKCPYLFEFLKRPGVYVHAAFEVLAEVHELFRVVLALQDFIAQIFLLLLSVALHSSSDFIIKHIQTTLHPISIIIYSYARPSKHYCCFFIAFSRNTSLAFEFIIVRYVIELVCVSLWNPYHYRRATVVIALDVAREVQLSAAAGSERSRKIEGEHVSLVCCHYGNTFLIQQK